MQFIDRTNFKCQ